MRPVALLRTVLSALVLLAFPAAAEATATDDAGRFIASFLRQRLDPTSAFAVESLTLVRDAATFRLDRGSVTFAAPVEGRVCSAVFTGEGSFSFTPPVAFERNELRRFLRTGALERRIRALVLIYADSTGDELARARRGGDAPTPDAQEHLDWYLQSLGEPKPLVLERAVAQPLLDGARTGMLFVEVVCEDDERLFLEIDPTWHEQVALARVVRGPYLVAANLRDRETVCRFPYGGVYDSLAFGSLRADLEVFAYRLDVRLASALRFSAVAELDARAAVDGATWIRFELEEHLVVDSVAWVGGGPAAFLRRPGSGALWVHAGTPTVSGERRTLRMSYSGSYIATAGDWLYPREATGWYPRPRAWLRATFDVTFRHPSSVHLTCAGEQVSSDTFDDVTTSRWVVRRPTSHVTFTLGDFFEKPFGTEATPPVQALIFKGKPSKQIIRIQDRLYTVGSPLQDWVIEDLVKGVEFFQQRLGPAQVPGFVVAQIPSTHGQAFPGLFNIPETGFAGPNAVIEDQVFRVHELAHQWWGYGVEARTYHDHWLIEGFAEFSSLWYLQAGLGRNQDYLAMLADWSQRLIDDEKVRPEKGRLPGPIWLGSRNSTHLRPYDYVLMDYTKGAWVLHMLRTLMLDLETMDDRRFEGLMREFYRTYAGSAASTEDFRLMAERHAGRPLDWFFDQWVYRTGVPRFEFATQTQRGADGKVRVRCRVRTSGVQGGFEMPVVIRLEFPRDQFAWVRRTITAPVTEFDLTSLPIEPSRIVFNDIQSVLAQVKDVKW